MNYIKRPRPEPIRIFGRERIIEKIVEPSQPAQPSQPIDIQALATAIASIINKNTLQIENKDEFDNSKTLEQLATSMVVQRDNNKSNFDNLGNENKTKTNKEEIDKTIDLLSKLND